MSSSEATIQEDSDKNLSKILQHLASEIRISWIRDCDKTDAMTALNNFILNILKKNNSLEEVLNQDEQLLQYFMNDFMNEVISNILNQPIVYGDNGDDIALDLLYNIYRLFLKFHKNKKYSPLFEKIRQILKEKQGQNFFSSLNDFKNQIKIDNPKKKYNYFKFNHQFCSEFMDKTKENENMLKEGDNIDLLIQYDNSKTQIDKKAWVRGTIKSIDKDKYNYIIECPELDSELAIQINSYEVAPEGSKTKDWEWRRNLKKYDLIDCFDRNKWFPATIMDVNEKILKNGSKTISYNVGFRLYPNFFKNTNDENDKYENYKCFWQSHVLELDEKLKEQFYGDKDNFDEKISFYSKRIQKFQSYTNIQKDFLNQVTHYSAYGSYNRANGNKMERMNYELENDGEIKTISDDLFLYEKEGKKNYIIGKTSKFSYYFALFLRKLADDNAFEEFIKIINNNPNSEEVLTIFHTLYYALPYLHKQYLIENLDNFKNGIINFINNLDTKEIRSLPKDLIEVITKFLNKVNKILKSKDNKETDNKEPISAIDEITINLSIKMIKTSIFDKRIQGIKALNDYINENIKNENLMKMVINLVQKNEIIKEIFGANYHSQIISKSDKILSLLLKNNEIKEDDIKLIWDCTQRGDLEAKSTIMKLLSDLAKDLNENFIDILLQSITNSINDNKMNEKEIDFIYNLSIHGDNENNKIKCCEYLYQCILKLDLNDNNFKNNNIIQKLVSLCGMDDKYLSKVLSMCENDLKLNNSSLFILQILSAIFDRYTLNQNELHYLRDYLKDFVKDDNLLNLYKNNYNNYVEKIKKLINNSPNKLGKESDNIGNYDEVIIDNYSHAINTQKRLEFLSEWIILIYPNFDFVPFLKEILINKPVSINDSSLFYEFMKKYISDNKANESEEQKEKKHNIKNQLFKIFTEKDQNSMTMSEFKLFIALFLGINDRYLIYFTDRDDNYDIHLVCNDVDELEEMDKLWNVIYQLKDEKVLNKAITIILSLYKNKNQLGKLLIKCKELIKDEKTTRDIIDKCFRILRTIIIESEKYNLVKIKSHSNLNKNSLIYLPLKLTPKNTGFYYYNNSNNNNNNNDSNDNITEIFYGNSTINEIKESLIEKGKIPLKYIEVSLSKEYMDQLKENKNKKKDKEKNSKENKNEENEFILDESYNNKSIMEILNNNYNIGLVPNKIFIFKSKNIEKVNLLEGNELNPKFKEILKQWFNQFTEGTGKMDPKSCSRYISGVTTHKELVPEDDSRIEKLFNEYDKDKLGYITEDKFLEFYLKSLIEKKEVVVWENLKAMGIREDLHKKDEPEEITYIENDKLPRYCLGNDKIFIDALFSLFIKFENKKDIFEFLFFLSTNKEIYDNVLNYINKLDEKNFEKIFDDKKTVLEQLYILTIIESILQDVNINSMDFSGLFEKCKKNDNRSETNIVMKSKNYEYFDDIEINKKKNFIKEFIINKNYEKLLEYMNKLLMGYKFDNNENDVLNICFEKCLKIINIIYNACFNNNVKNEDDIENNLNNNGILLLNYNNLSNIINEEKDIKESFEQIKFFDFSINLIKFITNINKNLNSKDILNNEINNNLLQNSFNLLINLISYNEKLQNELDSKEEIKQMLLSLIESALTCENEYYKSFYVKCLINSIKYSLNNNIHDNKFLNLLFEIANNIFNKMIGEKNINNDDITSKSSILFFDFFSLLSSTKTDDSGNEFLFKMYNILFNYIKNIENEKKISNDIFIGIMNILIKRIKTNKNTKNIIINKEIEGKTLIEIILEKIYKNDDKDKEKVLTENKITEENESKFINLDTLNEEKPTSKITINKEIKDICNDYLIECFQSSKDSKIIHELTLIINLLSKKKNNENEENGQIKINSSISTKNFDHVGLKNIGCICYMNSIMQQIYMVPTFRYAIMGCDDHESPKPSEYGRISTDDDNLLHQLQKMYTFLTFSIKEDYNPKHFCYSFKDFDGNPTNPMIQQDSQEFYNNFCDKIENSLKKTKYKYIVNDVLTGRTCSSVICESCKNVSNRFEDFYNLSLEVKNINNLKDSLQKMIMPEKIDDFKCSNCNKNVTISKRTSLCDLPNILVIHLKRFYMNYEIERTEKINSKFEFPLQINLKEFCIEDIISQITEKKIENEDIYMKEDEYYNYILKGINIHMGSADGGHYFSLINVEREGKGNFLIETEKDENNINNTNKNDNKKYKWLKFNDSHISIFDINDIEKECFGGSTRGYNYENFQNAYMLVYERKKKTPIRILYDENEVKEMNTKDNENIVKINKDNRKMIKKQYNLNKINSDINEKTLYNKIFNDEEKEEYFKYIPFYNIEKLALRKIYNQIIEKNKKIEMMKDNNEDDDNKYKKQYYQILLNNISLDDFNILSDNYDKQIKQDLINILIESIFTLISSKYPSQEEKIEVNSNTKIILEKIILPFITPYFNNEDILKISDFSIPEIIVDNENYLYILIITNILIQKEKLEKIYVNDLTAIFNNDNVELFSKIIKSLILINYKKNTNKYLQIIDELFNLVQTIDSTSTYPTILNTETNKTPLYYIYEILYNASLKDKDVTKKLIGHSAISTLLGKLSNENALCRSIILDIVTHLIKNTYEYNDRLFEIKDEIKKSNYNFHEKTYLIKSITQSIVELLFDERIELLIILIKILQYNELDFSLEFNIKHINELFDYSLKKNKIMDMIQILYGILEINDTFSFQRINSILGYPTLIIKQIKKDDDNTNENSNILYEEKKENDEEDKIKKVEERKNYWPLFGERLIFEDNEKSSENDLTLKLKKHIFKYIGINHKKPAFCLLSLLFPEEEENEKKNDDEELIEEKKRIKLIYDLLKLMLLGKGNYCLFKYIYLLPSRSIYYKNLYEEMIEIIEKENAINSNLYNLADITKNSKLCIKRINYEVNKTIKDIKNNNIYLDEYKNNEEYKLPKLMEKYYIVSDEVEKFIGTNPNMIHSDIVREEIQKIASGSSMFMMRIEYFTKYKTPDEIRKVLNNPKIIDKKEENKEEFKDQTKEKEKEIKENINTKEILNEKDIEQLIDLENDKNEEKKVQESEAINNKEEENEGETEINSEDEYQRISKIDISEVKKEIDGKEFMFEILSNLHRNSLDKIIIEDSSIKNLKKVKSSLIRFVIITTQTSDSDMDIKISEKDITNEARENYYYPNFFIDRIKNRNISNFMNINRIRSDLSFIKNNHIGINIDVKRI